MVAQSSSRARQRATRRMVCSFAKHRSIGFRSGLYFGRKQSVAHRRTPMHRQIVQHDDVAGAQRRCEHVFDGGEEAHAIDRTVEDGGGREAGHAQCGEKGRRVPAPVGGVVDHALAPLPTPVAANQIGPPATFIQKTRAARDPRSGRSAATPPGPLPRPAGRVRSRAPFFFRRQPSFVTARQIVGRLADVGNACCHSTSVRSGCSRIRIASRGNCAGRRGVRHRVWRRGAISPVSRRRGFRRSTHARLTAYVSATSFDAMPASLSLSSPRP